jgi:hypothetical protein
MAQARPKSRPASSLRLARTPARQRKRPITPAATPLSARARRSRAKFRRYFKQGFHDPLYIDWERDYKWEAHRRWEAELNLSVFSTLIHNREFPEIARRAVAIEARTNLLFSFEKMAMRDAIKSPSGARSFAEGLFEFLHGTSAMESRFTQWCEVVGSLPRRQTRVLTWPAVTIFGFIAQPKAHFFLKPTVTRLAAEQYGYAFEYQSRPNWQTYNNLLKFARSVSRDLSDMRPRDMIDIQSFLWVQGSDEYPD